MHIAAVDVDGVAVARLGADQISRPEGPFLKHDLMILPVKSPAMALSAAIHTPENFLLHSSAKIGYSSSLWAEGENVFPDRPDMPGTP